MESLPIDIWHQILKIGVETERLDHVDLCSLAIVNSDFDQLTQDPSLWASLFSRRFPFHFKYCDEDPSKAVYETLHVTEKEERELRSRFFSELTDSIIPYYSFREFHDYSYIISHPATPVYPDPQFNFIDISFMEYGSLEESDPVLLHSSEHSSRRAHIRRYEKKPSKCFDKSSRPILPKGIPNSKSYIPINRPPRRSMPRKI